MKKQNKKPATQVINVTEMNNGNLLSVTSFIVKDENSKKGIKLISESEKLFADKARENGIREEDVYDCLEDGNFSNGTYSLTLSWSLKVIK